MKETMIIITSNGTNAIKACAYSTFDFLKINNLCVNTIHGGYPIMGI